MLPRNPLPDFHQRRLPNIVLSANDTRRLSAATDGENLLGSKFGVRSVFAKPHRSMPVSVELVSGLSFPSKVLPVDAPKVTITAFVSGLGSWERRIAMGQETYQPMRSLDLMANPECGIPLAAMAIGPNDAVVSIDKQRSLKEGHRLSIRRALSGFINHYRLLGCWLEGRLEHANAHRPSAFTIPSAVRTSA